jgi:hypothetical protein
VYGTPIPAGGATPRAAGTPDPPPVDAERRGTAREPRSRPRERRADRRVRTVVQRFSGCLDRLRDRTRTVLSLRAGLGAPPALDRRQVAARVDLSVRRVTRLERRGVRQLRALGSAGGCGEARAGDATGVIAGASPVGSNGAGGSPTGSADAGAEGGADDGRSSATRAAGSSDVQGAYEDSSLDPPATFVRELQDASVTEIAQWLALAGIALFAVGLHRELRERRHYQR